jgi:hypothetical protein
LKKLQKLHVSDVERRGHIKPYCPKRKSRCGSCRIKEHLSLVCMNEGENKHGMAKKMDTNT